jgi:protein phosphatase PTC2/3
MDFVSLQIAQDQPLGKICEELMMFCLSPVSTINGFGCDNMTVVLVALYQGQSPEAWRAKVKERVIANPPEAFVKNVEG